MHRLPKSLSIVFVIMLAASLSGCVNGGTSEEEALYERTYVDQVYGDWDPFPSELNRMLEEDVEDLKSLGVNLISISVEYRLDEDGAPYTWVDEDLYLENLALAKENGFAVLLAPNFVFTGDMDLGEMGIDMDLEGYLDMSRDVAIKWAEIAERYGVEIFSPQNEFDNMIRCNFVDDFDDTEAISAIVNAWHEDMLSEIRDVFSGDVMAKLADIRETDDFSGYDMIGETVMHAGMHPRDFREHVRELYRINSEVAKRSSAEWVVAEFWMPYSEEWWPSEYVSKGVDLDQMQDDYYRIAIEEYLDFEGYPPSGFIFISYATSGMEILDRQAMGIIDDFFNGRYEAFESELDALPELEEDYIQSSMPEGFLFAANDDNPFKNTQVFETDWMHWTYEDKCASTDEQIYEENFVWLESIRVDRPEEYVTLRYVFTNTGEIPTDFDQYLSEEMELLERFLEMAVDNGFYFDMCEFGDELNFAAVLHLGFTEEDALEYYYEGLTLMHEYMPDAIICADVINFLNLRTHPDQLIWHETSGQVVDDVEFISRLVEMGAPIDVVGMEIQPGGHTYYDTDYIISYLERYRELGIKVYIWELWMLSEPLVEPNEQEALIYGAHAPPEGYSEEWQADTLRTLLDYISSSGNVIGFNYMFIDDGKFYWSQPYMNGLVRLDGSYKEGFYVMLDWYLGQ